MRAVKFTQKQLNAGVLVRGKGLPLVLTDRPLAFLPSNTLGVLCAVKGKEPIVEFEVGPNLVADGLSVPWRCIELVQ